MQDRLQRCRRIAAGSSPDYQFDSVHVVLIVPFGVQTGVSLGFESRGTVTEETYDAAGAPADRQTSPFDADVRVAPGDGRPLAQRGRPAAGASSA